MTPFGSLVCTGNAFLPSGPGLIDLDMRRVWRAARQGVEACMPGLQAGKEEIVRKASLTRRQVFCGLCDGFIHEMLHVCPGCEGRGTEAS